MATLYTDQAAPYATQAAPGYDTSHTRTHAHRHGSARTTGATIFVWIAWALAAAFWAATLTTALGILQAAPSGQAPNAGSVGAGGAGWGLMNFIGVAILGMALAYGAYRYSTRDRRKDPMTEASTAALYDDIERNGDDESTLSPSVHAPEERASYRPAPRDLH